MIRAGVIIAKVIWNSTTAASLSALRGEEGPNAEGVGA
jgi:hypothetical protein